MKRILSILLVALLVLSVSTGCSPEEQRFGDSMTRLLTGGSFQTDGWITLKTDWSALAHTCDPFPMDCSELALLVERLKSEGYDRVWFSGMLDTKSMNSSEIYSLHQNDGKVLPLVEIRVINGTTYVNAKGLAELFVSELSYSSGMVGLYLTKTGTQGTFVELTESEALQFRNLLPLGGIAPAMPTAKHLTSSQQTALLVQNLALLKDVQNTTLREFSPGFVKTDTSKDAALSLDYLTITPEVLSDCVYKTGDYALTHGDTMRTFIGRLTDDDFFSIGGSSKSQRQATFNALFDGMSKEPEKAANALKSLRDQESNTHELRNTFRKTSDFSLRIGLGKNAAGDLVIDATTMLAPTQTGFPRAESHTFEIRKSIATASVEKPNAVISLDALNDSLHKETTLYVNSGSYSEKNGLNPVFTGLASVKNVSGKVMVALPTAPPMLQKLITTDGSKFIFRNPVPETAVLDGGIVINNVQYLPISEFRKVGYTVTWNANDRTILISKN